LSPKRVVKLRHKDEADKPPYRYTECGLDDVYLLSGYEVDGEFVMVKDADELHKAIGCFLVTEKKLLSGKELRFLRKEMDLTQGELSKLLQISDQSVARWEKDKYEIPPPADFLMRLLFLDHIGWFPEGKNSVRELLVKLEDRDAPVSEAKQIFKPTKDGWRHLQAIAA
jgi:putative transcriptional regulator